MGITMSRNLRGRNVLATPPIRKKTTADPSKIRILLLGSGESGKSTLVRQLKLLKTDGYTDDEISYFKSHVRYNLVDWTIRFAETATYTIYISRSVRDTIEQLRKQPLYALDTDEKFTKSILRLVKEIDSKHDIVHLELPDSASYFFEHAERVMDTGYTPTNEDIVRCRIMTTGVHELSFTMKQREFTIIDVGGQRGQRKKWIPLFDNLQAVIFITSLSDYDRMLFEDDQINRLHDSLDLWQEISACPAMEGAAKLLFFNKNDIFEMKLPLSPLSTCFPDFVPDVSDTVSSARRFIEQKFLEKAPKNKTVFTHYTTMTDAKNVNDVITVTIDTVISQSLKNTKLF